MRVAVVWIPMLPGDNLAAARSSAAEIFAGAEIAHFYDSKRAAGKVFAKVIGGEAGKVAWDFYMFFRAGEAWGENPPSPEDWMHQLTDADWADPRRYHTGVALREHLALKIGQF